MQSHDADRADLIIASRSSRVLSHSDVLRLASACAPSFAGCLGLKLLFFSGASWHNIKQTHTLCTQGTWNTSSLSLHLQIPTYASPPVPVSNLRLKPHPSESRSTTTPPSFVASESIVRSVFSSALVWFRGLIHCLVTRNSLFSFWDDPVVGRRQLPGYGLCLGYKMKEGGLGKLQKKMRGRFGDMVCEWIVVNLAIVWDCVRLLNCLVGSSWAMAGYNGVLICWAIVESRWCVFELWVWQVHLVLICSNFSAGL